MIRRHGNMPAHGLNTASIHHVLNLALNNCLKNVRIHGRIFDHDLDIRRAIQIGPIG